MAVFRAFSAVRPAKEYARDVAALPYDVMDSEEAREMVKGKPLSFLHIDRAEVDLPEDTGIYEDIVYETAAATLRKWKSEGIFIKEIEPCFYIYALKMNGRTQTGLVGCASIDDYLDDVIKKHEFTRAEKEEDRVRHVDACDANTGPIFLTCRSKREITEKIESWKNDHAPEYDFTAEDGISHTVWVINDSAVCEELTAMFGEIPALYIADGHHRCASAVRVGKKRREAAGSWTGEEEFNYFLAVVFPDDELYIMDYNRVVRELNGKTKEEFLGEISEKCTVTEADEAVRPDKKGVFGLYLDHRWYRLEMKPEITAGRKERAARETAAGSGTVPGSENAAGRDCVAALDVSVLQEEILTPILGIGDPRTDERISFVGGIRGLEELERRVDGGEACAFSMYPTPMAELMAIADAGAVMPPKSTWFEPKLRSGLFIHELS